MKSTIFQCGSGDDRLTDSCQNIKHLETFFKISQLLDHGPDLGEVIEPILEMLIRSPSHQKAMLILKDWSSGILKLEHIVGLKEDEEPQAVISQHREGIDRVFEEGKAVELVHDQNAKKDGVLVPQVLRFYHPIARGEVIGVLALERWAKSERRTNHDREILSVVARMLSQAVKLRHEIFARRPGVTGMDKLSIPKAFRPPFIVGNSRAMQEVYEHIEQVAVSMATVMIRGESGVGKELVAQAIHRASMRREQPFVKFNCAALSDSIIESELFGHEKGAFTGATEMRKGRFESAHGGTIFIDEIGDISPNVQVKLLRVLQEKEIERVGSQESIPCDARVITATSRHLEEMMSQGLFREDLYYRLNVFPLFVPALRDRKPDILQLVDHFIEIYGDRDQKSIHRVSTAAIDLLCSYHWPGNVRELENCIERAVLLCHGDSIEAHHLPPTLQKSMEPSSSILKGDLQSSLDALELEILVSELKRCQGNMTKAAQSLGLTERKMGLRVKKYNIDVQRFKGL